MTIVALNPHVYLTAWPQEAEEIERLIYGSLYTAAFAIDPMTRYNTIFFLHFSRIFPTFKRLALALPTQCQIGCPLRLVYV